MDRQDEQNTGAELAGLNVRTSIDDMIGKLYALRSQLCATIPPELGGLLDDADEIIEKCVDLALDADAIPVTPRGAPSQCRDTFGYCSCGGITIDHGDAF